MAHYGTHWTPEQHQEVRRQLAANVRPSLIAKATGLNVNRIRKVRRTMLSGAAVAPAPAPAAEPAVMRQELRDALFWRRKAQTAQRELADAEHLAAQLAGLRGTPISVPEWLLDTRAPRRGRSVVGALISDVHMGEVIRAEEPAVIQKPRGRIPAGIGERT